jgi:metal-responsive CopG/Arc/MetJ family transcriptional regulator
MYESKVTQMTNYITIKLPKDLVKQIDDFLQKQNLGYASRAELVKDAVRSFLAKIKQDKSG